MLVTAGADASVIWGTFVSTDRFEFQPKKEANPCFDAVLLYWLESQTPASGGAITAKYRIAPRGGPWLGARQLALKNGAAYSWTWNVDPNKRFAGDYLRGGFFLSDLSGKGKTPTLNFFLPWNESVGGPTTNALFHGNIVSWEDPGGAFTPCRERCVDYDSDSKNCGACGHACPKGQHCVDGKCRKVPGGGSSADCPPGWIYSHGECCGQCVCSDGHTTGLCEESVGCVHACGGHGH